MLREKRIPNSACWFLDSLQFKNWVSNLDTAFFWCPGKGSNTISTQ